MRGLEFFLDFPLIPSANVFCVVETLQCILHRLWKECAPEIESLMVRARKKKKQRKQKHRL